MERLLSFQWNMCRLDNDNFISSPLERPKILDIIWFGLNPANGNPGKLVRPLAHTLIAQFAAWVDEHFPVIALEVEGYQEARQKNRAAKLDALTHAVWKAIDWYLHDNVFWLFSENVFRLLKVWVCNFGFMPCIIFLHGPAVQLGKEDNGVTIRQALDRFELQHVTVSRFGSRLTETSLMYYF